MTPERAEILGLEGLSWLAGDDDALPRFLAASGMDGAALREAAGSPGAALAVIDFLLAHEDLVQRFCEDTSTDPRTLHQARHCLDGAA